MSNIGGSNLNLNDYVSRTDPNGGIAKIVESLDREIPLVKTAVAHETNKDDCHEFSSRLALPSVYRRRLNKGTPSSKSRTGKTKEPLTMIEARSIIDVEEAGIGGNVAANRASEDVAFMEVMGENAEEIILYDSKKNDPDEANGLISRLDSTTGDAGGQIVVHDTGLGAAGSVHTCATVLFVGWNDEKVFLGFPKGTTGGLKPYVFPTPQLVPDENGDTYMAYVTNWNWKLGPVVKDKRYLSAVRNINMADRAALEGSLASPTNSLLISMLKAYKRIKNPGACKLICYVPRDIEEILYIQALNSTANSTLSIRDYAGQPTAHFFGTPVMIADKMTLTEDNIA